VPKRNMLRKNEGNNTIHNRVRKKYIYIRCLGINLSKEVRKVYNENYKTLEKIEDTRR
jgi:hypothetical protein